MQIGIKEDGTWFHGSNVKFDILRAGSTVTQWQALAEAFSHKPSGLGYDDDGRIEHNGTEYGYLYVIDEPVRIGVDVVQHPRSSMDQNAEFLTTRDLKVRWIKDLPPQICDSVKNQETMTFEDQIDPATYNHFRESVGWGTLLPEQVEAILANSICFSLLSEGKTIAISRILWDGGYTAYIADVIVAEPYRGQGIGKKMVDHALEEIRRRMKPGWKVRVILLASKGRESFYEQFGFVKRPNDHEGCGMNLILKQ